MKIKMLFMFLLVAIFLVAYSPAAMPAPVVDELLTESSPKIICGETIMENTTLVEDLACPPGTDYAIVIGGSNLTLDLGGHVILGHAPGTGVFSTGQEGITIRNGTIEGFNAGVFIIETNLVTMENLTVRNLDISDPNHFIFGIQILGSQNVVVRDSLFEFLSVPHKNAVEIFDSYVDVSNIEVRGGGSGVSFSFAGGVCDPVNSPSNGTVLNSKFSDIYVAGIWIACSSSALIEGNDFSTAPGVSVGIQGDAPFLGAVTGLTVQENFIHGAVLGIEFRGISESSISNNYVFDNQGWGIAMRQSMGCLTPEPSWECFYSTANVIADNKTWGNVIDLYHYKDSLGNVWERNRCETKDGVEIPECTPPIFTDVPFSYWAINFIERLYNAGITGGCSISPLMYCPETNVTRAQMAIFILRGIHGSAYTPPAATGTVFIDVPLGSFAADWIEQLALEGVTAGCGGGNYCPDATITRAQMAIFLLRGEHGSAYTPPAATGAVFGDVPLGSFADAWIEQLFAEGVTGGCGSGNYCPNNPFTRAEMAVFLVRAFNLP